MEKIVEFYVEQYREVCREAGKKARMQKYMHKINAKLNVLKNTHATSSKEESVALLHRDVKRLAQAAYYYGNKEAVKKINRELLAELCRMDMEMLEIEEREAIDDALLKELKKEQTENSASILFHMCGKTSGSVN